LGRRGRSVKNHLIEPSISDIFVLIVLTSVGRIFISAKSVSLNVIISAIFTNFIIIEHLAYIAFCGQGAVDTAPGGAGDTLAVVVSDVIALLPAIYP
jgi:hypothetical protein